MGDSITYYWWLPKVNYGVPGNTTAQMLVRFPTQVLGHSYKAVVILGGTNDVRTKVHPLDEEVETAMANIDRMVSMAENDHLTVVLCKILPIGNEDSRAESMNEAIESYAVEHHLKLVDYYSRLVGHPEYFRDSVHPNEEGYFVMETALIEQIPLDY